MPCPIEFVRAAQSFPLVPRATSDMINDSGKHQVKQ